MENRSSDYLISDNSQTLEIKEILKQDCVDQDEWEDIISLLIDGGDVNLKDSNGEPLLIRAMFYGNIEVMKFLLRSANIDINLQDKDGNTALSLAINRNKEEMTDLILNKGIPTVIQNNTQDNIQIERQQTNLANTQISQQINSTEENRYKTDDCPVCREDFDEYDVKRVFLRCGHNLCESCEERCHDLQTGWRVKSECPICRTEL